MDGERDDARRTADRRRVGDERTDMTRDAKRDAYVAEMSARLRHVCRHLTDAEFSQLVLDMAETRLRLAVIDAGAWPQRRPGPEAADIGDQGRRAP